ncbi:MAG: hypothetical protein WCL53_07350 [Chloroflexota bacterium]
MVTEVEEQIGQCTEAIEISGLGYPEKRHRFRESITKMPKTPAVNEAVRQLTALPRERTARPRKRPSALIATGYELSVRTILS